MQAIWSFVHQLYTIKQNKSPLALTMIKDTWWMMGLALYHTAILIYCKYLWSLLIIFSDTFVIYFNFEESQNRNERTLCKLKSSN